MKRRAWWITNLILIVIFAAIALFLMLRKVDGSGAVQTMSNRLAAEVVLGIVFLIVSIIQLVLLRFVKK
ncbi:DUF3923 family protein [Lentilactobacillus sunkii]|uniref:DUF3923 family protein n=1 Tax=Lentilactobacillus sunkii TaxID=481719 RepID=UPI00070D205E|nr:DUF3923 family protein [Lentilactobacillus sunkii]